MVLGVQQLMVSSDPPHVFSYSCTCNLHIYVHLHTYEHIDFICDYYIYIYMNTQYMNLLYENRSKTV